MGSSSSKLGNPWVKAAILAETDLIIVLKKLFPNQRKENKVESGKMIGSPDKDNIIGSLQNYREEEEEEGGCCGIRTYGLEELRIATKNFSVRVGIGATSYVYLAELGGGKVGAVKRVMKERGGSKKMFLHEVSVLLRISHPNLVKMMGFCLEKGEQLLLLEYVPNKSLFHRLHTHDGQSLGTLSWANRLNIALDVARALEYLHSRADPLVIHRDVKSSNVLLIDDNHAKLADFGLCKLGPDPGVGTPDAIKGSIGYTDTYYLKTGEVSSKSDVYSFGVLLLELITGLKSLQGSTTLAEWTEEHRRSHDFEALARVVDPKLGGNVNADQLQTLIDVADSALLENSAGRPTMSQIIGILQSCLQHPLGSPA